MHAFQETVDVIKKVESLKQFRETLSFLQTTNKLCHFGFISVTQKTPSLCVSTAYNINDPELEILLCNNTIAKLCKTQSSPIPLWTINSIYPYNLYLLPTHAGHNEHGALIIQINEKNDVDIICWFWSALASHLINTYNKVLKPDKTLITERERDCLVWACEGKTSWEISQILNVSERTVNFHLANCIEKTQSTNRQQTIAKCVLANII
jgi:DNA-binding CsgD family transcriptional regulator